MRNFNNPKEIVKVQSRSGFDKSHFSLLSSSVGTITPILVDEVIPNTKVHLRLNLGASMPPLASDTYMKCDVAIEAFFVPFRLLDGGFMDFFTQNKTDVIDSLSVHRYNVSFCPPVLAIDTSDQDYDSSFFYGSTLADYLGFGVDNIPSGSWSMCAYPFLAYHLIWDNYYRNPLVQKSAFVKPNYMADLKTTQYPLMCAPYVGYYSAVGGSPSTNYLLRIFDPSVGYTLGDGDNIFNLRQRNYGFDYFTNSFPQAQLGDAQEVTVSSNKFTISALRAAASLQNFEERNAIGGVRFNDALKARYNADLSNGMAQRPVLLGSAKYNVYNKSLVVSASNSTGNMPNPFAQQAGAIMGNAYASGSDLIVDGFTANEPGYIWVNATLVPTATYGTYFRKYLQHYRSGHASIVDMANHLLQNTGNQPIHADELTGDPTHHATIFGYTDRYAEFMTMPDEVHGLFRPNYNLDSFVCQRWFANAPTLSSSFLKINVNALDNNTATVAASSQYGYWLQCQFDYKVSMPLAEYSVPSLQDPAWEHGDTVVVHRGGFRF